jgi:hypothetical protein
MSYFLVSLYFSLNKLLSWLAIITIPINTSLYYKTTKTSFVLPVFLSAPPTYDIDNIESTLNRGAHLFILIAAMHAQNHI